MTAHMGTNGQRLPAPLRIEYGTRHIPLCYLIWGVALNWVCIERRHADAAAALEGEDTVYLTPGVTEGYGLVERARPLIHHYVIEKVRLPAPVCHPYVHNSAHRKGLKVRRERYVNSVEGLGLERAVGGGRVVRAFDPLHCLCDPLIERLNIILSIC